MQHRSQRFAILAALAALLLPSTSFAFDPNYILSDEELTDSQAMDLNQIQAFLERGTLATYQSPDWEGRTRYAADILWRTAQDHNINPRFLLVLLQKEQSLVEDQDPTQKQYDWATGYAVCDDCSMNDGSLSRWQGFGKQVNSAAMQFTEGYMLDIAERGVTAGKYGPDLPVTIDGTTVTPENAATAAMYAYTPHLHGNSNFVAIWDKWFGKEYPSGTLLQAAGQDGVYRIEHGYRRPITSKAALTSRYNSALIITVSKTTLEQYPEGAPISLPNYSLVKDENGSISLLVDDTMRHVESMEAFRQIGYSEDELVDITAAEVAQYTVGTPITASTQDPTGKVVKLTTNGAMFYLNNGIRQAILDPAILTANFPTTTVENAAPVVIEQYREGSFLKLPDGTLVRSYENPAVYVVSEGKKMPITSEQTFLDYGYAWSNVIFVSDDVLNLHPTGDDLLGSGT
ncbi:MAG: hypothetical protein AAB473_00820 [Patescibacteria group bacterium]